MKHGDTGNAKDSATTLSSRGAYLTLVANEPFVIGELVLRESLRRCGSIYEFVVALTESGDRRIERRLQAIGVHTVRVSYEAPPDVATFDAAAHRWNVKLAKLGVFRLAEYSKLVFLDADTIALANLDALIDLPHMSAVRTRALQHGGTAYGFNSGVMGLEPNRADEFDIARAHARVHAQFSYLGQPYGDQNVLNEALPDWHSYPSLQLPDGFIVFFGSLDDYVRRSGFTASGDSRRPGVRLVHFTGVHKPWERRMAFALKAAVRSPRHRRKLPALAGLRVLAEYWRIEVCVRRMWRHA